MTSNTTTVLFTDLVDSTSDLLPELGDEAYADLFAQHVAQVRVEVERHGGTVAELLGDGVMAMFPSATASVETAVRLQQLAERSARGASGPVLAMRAGLHVGDVVDRIDDVFGTTIAIARRLCAIAGPGQIVASDLMRALLMNRPEFTFAPLGAVELEGLDGEMVAATIEWEPLPAHPVIRVVIADDAPLIRAGLVRLLADEGFTVIGEAADAAELILLVDSDPPDLIVTDIRMPPTNRDEGLVAAGELRSRHPDLAVMVLSQHIEARGAAALLDGRPAGVGYLLKERVSELGEFVEACRTVVDGGSVIDPMVADELFRRRRNDTSLARLSERERDVLRLMAEGQSNREIGDTLFLGAKTVETHVGSIFRKLDLDPADGHRRVHAVIRWLQENDS